jgi:hypothetical protein
MPRCFARNSAVSPLPAPREFRNIHSWFPMTVTTLTFISVSQREDEVDHVCAVGAAVDDVAQEDERRRIFIVGLRVDVASARSEQKVELVEPAVDVAHGECDHLALTFWVRMTEAARSVRIHPASKSCEGIMNRSCHIERDRCPRCMTATPRVQKNSDFESLLLVVAGLDLRQPLQILQSAHELPGLGVRTNFELRLLRSGQSAIDRLKEQLDQLLAALRLCGALTWR